MDGMPSPVRKLTRTTCPYCGVGCGVLAGPDGTLVGDPDHPANFGRLCSKGTALGETIALPGRLLHPEVRGKRASWDVALDAVAEGFSTRVLLPLTAGVLEATTEAALDQLRTAGVELEGTVHRAG